MKDLLTYIVAKIVSQPEQVRVEEETLEGDVINLRLQVAPEDMGIVIGRSGNIIHAIRDLLRIRAIKENKRVNLELVESSEGKPETQPTGEATNPEADKS